MDKQQNSYLKIIKDVRSLPTIPGIIVKILSLLDDNKTPFKEISKLISSDQTLSSRILRLANSPFYGLPGHVTSIPAAMVMLGAKAIKGLVLTSIIFEMTEKDALGFWEHSLGTATAANVVSKHLNVGKPEVVSTAALLHDIGKVIIKSKLGDGYGDLKTQVEEQAISMRKAELTMLEVDHAEVGGWAVRSWGLPEALCEPIASHHEVATSNTYRSETSIVHLADILIKAAGFGFTGDYFVPPIQDVAWESLQLNASLLEEITEKLASRLVEVKEFSQEIQAAED